VKALTGEVAFAIRAFIKENGGPCKVYEAPFAVFLNKDNQTCFEPDISVVCDASKLDERRCNGAPDWIVEIASPSTAGNGYIRKLHAYEAGGVREGLPVDFSRIYPI